MNQQNVTIETKEKAPELAVRGGEPEAWRDAEKVEARGVVFIRELAIVYRGSERARVRILEPEDAALFIKGVLPDNSREHFVALYLDGSHQVVAYQVVGTGIANSCPVHPREVFQPAVLVGAIAIVLGSSERKSWAKR
jgi:DNA repair protein RadC